MDGTGGMARLRARSPLPAAPDLQPAEHAAALPVRQRRLQPGLQGQRPRADPAAPRRRARARHRRRRRRAGLQRPRQLSGGRGARRQPAPLRRPAGDGRMVGSRRARRPRRARPARQPQRAHARQGHPRLAQGPIAQTALVQLERYDGVVPAVQAFTPPEIVARRP
jgi:hypothetical protein